MLKLDFYFSLFCSFCFFSRFFCFFFFFCFFYVVSISSVHLHPHFAPVTGISISLKLLLIFSKTNYASIGLWKGNLLHFFVTECFKDLMWE